MNCLAPAAVSSSAARPDADAEDALVALAARRVPRYTSYPTALQFSPAVDERTYRGWLGRLPAETALSVYLHVPFCRTLCLYCGCHTRAERREGAIDAYAEALVREIGLVAGALPGRMRIAHIHWGGGTPADLGAERLARVHAALAACFDLDPDVEHAIELDPRRVDAALASALAGLGVNRASLGVQTFDPRVQNAIGRVQPFATVARAVGELRAAGIDAINVDLMYGLPYQSVADVIRTAERAASLGADRISAFGYAHVPWAKKNQRGIDEAALPGPRERLAQMRAMRRALGGSGYVPVGFDHFARPGDPMAVQAAAGTLARNFQGYTTDRAATSLIGFGASAIGRLGQGHVQNEPGIEAYAAAIGEGRLPIARGVAPSPDDRRRAVLIEAVLCRGTILIDAVPPEQRAEVFDRLGAYAAEGLVAFDGREIRLTERGWPFARLVASVFDAHLADDTSRHSLCV